MSNDKTPDFSNVQGGVQSTEQLKPDFSNVESKVTSTEAILGGEGGGGSTGQCIGLSENQNEFKQPKTSISSSP